MEIGDHLIIVDEVGRTHNGLVTAVWSNQENPSLNAVIVSDNSDMIDTYGRQLNRQYTSLTHMSQQQAHGRYYRRPEEAGKPTESSADYSRKEGSGY